MDLDGNIIENHPILGNSFPSKIHQATSGTFITAGNHYLYPGISFYSPKRFRAKRKGSYAITGKFSYKKHSGVLNFPLCYLFLEGISPEGEKFYSPAGGTLRLQVHRNPSRFKLQIIYCPPISNLR